MTKKEEWIEKVISANISPRMYDDDDDIFLILSLIISMKRFNSFCKILINWKEWLRYTADHFMALVK